MWTGDTQGGGFVDPSQGGNQSDAVGGDKAKGGRRSNNIAPVTIKQILECQTESVHVLDIEMNTITILGLVTAVEQATTKISLHIDDQTGVIDCINYVGTEGANPSEIPFVPVEGTYGRIVGAMRTSKAGTKYLIIHKFLPVTDMNELTAHMLEVIQLPLKLKKLKEAEGLKTGIGMSSSGMNNTLSNSMIAGGNFGGGNFGGGGTGVLGMTGGSGGGVSSSTGGGGQQGGGTKSAFTPIQRAILSIIQNNASDSGIHKDEIMRNLQGKCSPKELEKLLEDLGGEGHIYSTVDDDHYRSTD